MALGDIHLHFAWQAWHLTISTIVSRGSRGTWRHPPSLCVAGVALGDSHLRFVWQAGHLWHWLALWRAWSLLGRHWSRGDAVAVCVVGVALGDIHLHFAWQAWHLATATFILRGRQGTWHSLSHTTLSHTIFHTQLCQTLSFTNSLSHTIFVTHHLSHTLFHTPSLSHTIFRTPSLHTTLYMICKNMIYIYHNIYDK